MSTQRIFCISTGLVAAVIVLSGCGQGFSLLLTPVALDRELQETVVEDPGWWVRAKVLIVDVDGLLVNQRSEGLFGAKDNPVSLFVEKLDKAAANKRIKAVILRINSPGGTVTASDIMYRRLMRFRSERNIPIVVVIEDVGASGAYYLACAGDVILAHPTSITGSIGVILQTVSLAGTMRMLGVQAQAITSGPYKDMASPLKPLDKKDLAILQGIVDSFYERFVSVVAAGRKGLDEAQVRSLADGRVFTAAEAKANGLVDQLGYMETAVGLAKKLAGIKRARVVVYHRPLGYRANTYSRAGGMGGLNLRNISLPTLLQAVQPQFLYLWTGRTAQ